MKYVCAAMVKSIVLEKGAPVIADVLTVIVYLILLPRLTAFFLNKSLLKGVLVGAIYLIFCASVVIIRKLPGPADQKTGYHKGWMGFFSIFFGYRALCWIGDGREDPDISADVYIFHAVFRSSPDAVFTEKTRYRRYCHFYPADGLLCLASPIRHCLELR